jgi:hypothetical protein
VIAHLVSWLSHQWWFIAALLVFGLVAADGGRGSQL